VTHFEDDTQVDHALAWDVFAERATKVLAEADPSAGPPSQLSVITLEDLQALEARTLEFSIAELLESAAGKLAALAIDQSLVTLCAPDMLCVVHRPDAPLEDAMAWIGTRATEIDPDEKPMAVSRQMVPLDPGKATHESACAALNHVLEQVAIGARVPEIANLEEGFEALQQHHEMQIKAFRCTVLSGNLSISLQPVVSLPDRKLMHYEALARFQPISDSESPAHYLGLAEKSGLIAEFDYCMAQRVVEMIEAYDHADALPPIAVNLSAVSLTNKRFLRSMLRLLNRHSAVAGALAFEITHSSDLKHAAPVNAAIQHLRQAGAPVGLDDFGAKNADLNMLSRLNVDYVKIDGRYVESLLETPRAKSFLKAITSLCDDLGIETVAKAVETEATAQFLAENGVSCGQGYVFGKPRYAASVLNELRQAPANAPATSQDEPSPAATEDALEETLT
jgi:EAL domain-containing protein (putative c-di-GMP-specific phosphodiesterase class I)